MGMVGIVTVVPLISCPAQFRPNLMNNEVFTRPPPVTPRIRSQPDTGDNRGNCFLDVVPSSFKWG